MINFFHGSYNYGDENLNVLKLYHLIKKNLTSRPGSTTDLISSTFMGYLIYDQIKYSVSRQNSKEVFNFFK